MVISKEVRVFQDCLYCDNCNTEMESTGSVFTSCPPLFEYICPKCGKKVNKHERYPSISYKPLITKYGG